MPNVAAGTGSGTIQFLQGTTSINGTASSPAKAFDSNNTAGNLLVVAVEWANNPGITAAISDSQGNLYATAVGPTVVPVNTKGQIFYVANCKGGANTVTVTLSGVSGGALDLFLHEYTGASLVAPLDQTASSTGNGNSLSSGNAPQTTQSNELLFGFGVAGNITAPGSNYTFRETGDGDATEDQMVNAAGQYSATFTQVSGSNWTAQIATFKAAPVNPSLTLMSNTGAVTNSTGRVKYRLSVGPGQPAGIYTTVITYTILGTF